MSPPCAWGSKEKRREEKIFVVSLMSEIAVEISIMHLVNENANKIFIISLMWI